MNLVPILVPISLACVVALSRRSHRQSSEGQDVFTFPKALAYFMALIGLAFASVPLWPGAVGDADPILFYACFEGAFLLTMLFVMYLSMYRVIIDTETFTVGALFRKQYRRIDITEVKLRHGQRSSDYFVQLRNGKRLQFSGLLGDFNVLTALLRPGTEPIAHSEHGP